MTENTPPVSVKLDWQADFRMQAQNSKGSCQAWDGKGATSLGPMEGILAALCSCMTIDLLTILQKMRYAPKSIRIEAEGIRNDSPPKYFRQIHLIFHVAGEMPVEKVERAIRLSFDTYCSVFHSLRQDLQATHELRLTDA